MEKYFVEWNGNKFPVREVQLPEELGGYEVNVADYELFNAIEDDYYNDDPKAVDLDNDIFFYCDSGFIASDPTDEEIFKYLVNAGI